MSTGLVVVPHAQHGALLELALDARVLGVEAPVRHGEVRGGLFARAARCLGLDERRGPLAIVVDERHWRAGGVQYGGVHEVVPREKATIADVDEWTTKHKGSLKRGDTLCQNDASTFLS